MSKKIFLLILQYQKKEKEIVYILFFLIIEKFRRIRQNVEFYEFKKSFRWLEYLKYKL